MESLKNLERVALKELEKLNTAYEGKNEFTEADAKKFDMLAHAWKSLLTAEAMHEANEKGHEQSYRNSVNYGGNYRNSNSEMPYSYYDGRHGNMSREIGDGWSGHYPPPWYSHYSRGNGWDY